MAEMKNEDGDAEEKKDDTQSAAGKSSPAFGKKKKSVGKKGKVADENTVLPVTLKPSKNVRNKMILGEKVETPPEILEKIKAEYEDGVNSIPESDIRELVDEMYTRVQKKRLVRCIESNKMKLNFNLIHRFLYHIALNIGP